MNQPAFVKILQGYDLPTESVYEDVSEIGTVLWHNSTLAVKVVWAFESRPCLLLVVLHPTNDYSYFQCDLAELDSTNVARIIEHAKDHADSLHAAAMTADNTLSVLVDQQDRTFSRVY